MLLSESKLLFDSGQLKSCMAVHHALSFEWCLQFDRKGTEPVFMDAQRVSLRIFKTLDAAFKAAREVGFIKIEVYSQ